MRFRITENATGAHDPFSIHFTVVPSVASFFINLVLNYLEKSDTHSPSTQRHLFGKSGLVVMHVTILAMASPIDVRNAILVLMSNVLWA